MKTRKMISLMRDEFVSVRISESYSNLKDNCFLISCNQPIDLLRIFVDFMDVKGIVGILYCKFLGGKKVEKKVTR